MSFQGGVLLAHTNKEGKQHGLQKHDSDQEGR